MNDFIILRNFPDSFMDNTELAEPKHATFIKNVGPQNIVDALSVSVENDKLQLFMDPACLINLTQDQREVIFAHLYSVCNQFSHVHDVKDYIIKYEFLQELYKIAALEESPGEFYEDY